MPTATTGRTRSRSRIRVARARSERAMSTPASPARHRARSTPAPLTEEDSGTRCSLDRGGRSSGLHSRGRVDTVKTSTRCSWLCIAAAVLIAAACGAEQPTTQDVDGGAASSSSPPSSEVDQTSTSSHTMPDTVASPSPESAPRSPATDAERAAAPLPETSEPPSDAPSLKPADFPAFDLTGTEGEWVLESLDVTVRSDGRTSVCVRWDRECAVHRSDSRVPPLAGNLRTERDDRGGRRPSARRGSQ